MPSETGTQEIFDAVAKRYGFVPNLIREMSRNPAVARVYLGGQDALADGVLSGPEKQALQLAISVFNECEYCRAAHSTGSRMAGLGEADVDAIERGELPQSPRLRTLVSAAWQLLEAKGFLTADQLKALEAEGVDRAQLYEVVALVGLKTISNYVNHIAHTPIDAAFAGPAQGAASAEKGR